MAYKHAFEGAYKVQSFVSNEQLYGAALKYVSERATSGFVSGSISYAASDVGKLRDILKVGYKRSALSAGIATLNISAHAMRTSMIRQSIRGKQPLGHANSASSLKEAFWSFKVVGTRT